MMKTMATVVTLALALALVTASPARAACTLDTQVVYHGFGGYFQNCPDAQPILGYGYLISDSSDLTGANSAGQGMICNDSTVSNFLGIACQPESGVVGDGMVTVQYDWGSFNSGSVGCPNPGGAGDGTTPIAIEVVANNGASLVVTIGFNVAVGGFSVDQAHPYNFATDTISPLSCGFANGPVVVGAAGPNNLCVNVPVPTIFSDCDPGTVGEAQALCLTAGSSRPTTARGKLYTVQAPCAGPSPDPRLSQWTLLANQPDGSGNACNALPTPGAGLCSYVGVTGIIGGSETPAILGSLRMAGLLAAVDRIKIDKAGFAQGRLKVAFSTENEAMIVGFNVYAGTSRLNTGLIPAKGVGSNSYSYEIGRGAVRANRTVTVEAVKSDGTVEKTAPHALK